MILIHEWNGLTRRIKETADAFAAEGYMALAADLYSGRIGLNRDENIALVQETMQAPDQIIRNLNAALQTLKARPDVPGQVATIGWCYGGGIALSFALGGDNHDGTAIFYGRLLNDPEVLKQVQHEVYGTFAGLDRGPSVEQVSAFVAGRAPRILTMTFTFMKTYNMAFGSMWIATWIEIRCPRNTPGIGF